jgi:SPP1 family phage portal protein
MMDEVNFNENWAANTSSLALRNKLLNLENRVAIREAYMERTIRQRLRNLFTFVTKKEGQTYDVLDIAIRFTRNLPTDLAGLADVISKLQEVCSQETLLTLLPFVENPMVEIRKFKTEQASAGSTDVAGAKEGETS